MAGRHRLQNSITPFRESLCRPPLRALRWRSYRPALVAAIVGLGIYMPPFGRTLLTGFSLWLRYD